MHAIVCFTCPRKPNSIQNASPERRFERENTIYFVELVEEFPRLIRAKLRFKVDDNHLHTFKPGGKTQGPAR
jgi:hypothetical protein